ncbi:MAG: hypothetical protein L0G23_05150, partial [Ruaniaceae bacterium]|nr:hypothetical protein [Ruaniaceae bacterium]
MKPLDPRLLAHARPARIYMGVTVLTGVLTTILVLTQVLLIANILGPAVDGSQPAPAWMLPTLVGA